MRGCCGVPAGGGRPRQNDEWRTHTRTRTSTHNNGARAPARREVREHVALLSHCAAMAGELHAHGEHVADAAWDAEHVHACAGEGPGPLGRGGPRQRTGGEGGSAGGSTGGSAGGRGAARHMHTAAGPGAGGSPAEGAGAAAGGAAGGAAGAERVASVGGEHDDVLRACWAKVHARTAAGPAGALSPEGPARPNAPLPATPPSTP